MVEVTTGYFDGAEVSNVYFYEFCICAFLETGITVGLEELIRTNE